MKENNNFKVGDKFTHLHFGYPQKVTITEIKNDQYFLSNNGYNGGSWYLPDQLKKLNKRYLNTNNYSK